MFVFISNDGRFASFRISLINFKTQIVALLPKCLMNSGYKPSNPVALPSLIELIAAFITRLKCFSAEIFVEFSRIADPIFPDLVGLRNGWVSGR